METGHKQKRSEVKVVVVGAGMSGLSTARHLLQAGFVNVTILEASNRTGGRIKSVRPGEGEEVVEMGATWIHGASMDNPIYKMASEWGMADTLVSLNRLMIKFYQENGETSDEDIVKQVWKFYQEVEGRMQGSKKTTKDIQSRKSVLQVLQEAKPQLLQQFQNGDKQEAAEKVLNAMFNYSQCSSGDQLHKISADLLGTYQTFPGLDMTFRGNGYSGFVEKMLENIPDGMIHFNSEVDKITWGESQVEILCRNDRKYTADHVIVTCSLGHLKANHKRMFQPALPEAKAGAIERTGFGRVNKLNLCYDQPFWTAPIGLAWSSHGQPIREKSDWMRDVLFFTADPKALCGVIGGQGAEAMESLSDEEVAAHCTEYLRKFLKDPSIPPPSKVLRSSWIGDPLFRGSYTYMSQVNEDGDILQLADPLPDLSQPRLLFAGEHTHPDFYSTVHGAFLTGVRESQRLVECYTE